MGFERNRKKKMIGGNEYDRLLHIYIYIPIINELTHRTYLFAINWIHSLILLPFHCPVWVLCVQVAQHYICKTHPPAYKNRTEPFSIFIANLALLATCIYSATDGHARHPDNFLLKPGITLFVNHTIETTFFRLKFCHRFSLFIFCLIDCAVQRWKRTPIEKSIKNTHLEHLIDQQIWNWMELKIGSILCFCTQNSIPKWCKDLTLKIYGLPYKNNDNNSNSDKQKEKNTE